MSKHYKIKPLHSFEHKAFYLYQALNTTSHTATKSLHSLVHKNIELVLKY